MTPERLWYLESFAGFELEDISDLTGWSEDEMEDILYDDVAGRSKLQAYELAQALLAAVAPDIGRLLGGEFDDIERGVEFLQFGIQGGIRAGLIAWTDIDAFALKIFPTTSRPPAVRS